MPALRLDIARLSRFVPWWLAPVFIAICFAYGLQVPSQFVWSHAQTNPLLLINIDQDTTDLSNALLAHPHFRDTLEWWHRPWLSNVPYFRPLSMMLFWTQYKIFGSHGLLGFEALHWFYHGLFLVLLWGFFSQLAGRVRAAFAVGVFAAGFNEILLLPSGTDAFNCWKDSVDIWSVSFMVIAAWTYVSYLRSGNRYWWLATLAAWVLNLTIKEAGYITPFILILVLWHEQKIRTHWKSLASFFILAPCAWVYRSWALSGYGNKTGSGDAWPVRFLLECLGLPTRIVNGDWLTLTPLVLLVGIAYFLWRRERKEPSGWKGLAIGTPAALFCLAFTIYHTEIGLTDTLARLTVRDGWKDLPTFAAIATIWTLFLAQRERVQIFALLWIWINFIPLIIQPPTSPHVHYPIAPGWSLFLACSVWALFDLLFPKPQQTRDVPHLAESTA